MSPFSYLERELAYRSDQFRFEPTNRKARNGYFCLTKSPLMTITGSASAHLRRTNTTPQRTSLTLCPQAPQPPVLRMH